MKDMLTSIQMILSSDIPFYYQYYNYLITMDTNFAVKYSLNILTAWFITKNEHTTHPKTYYVDLCMGSEMLN